MTNTQYKLNNTENTIDKLKKAYNLDDEFIDAIKQSVIADVKANMPKSEKSSGDKILELAKSNRKFNCIRNWAGLMSSLFIKR
ncbi:hypothetical protein [Staphylococcus shinii]|uniref:hypothetical protein n=1 Tax=Staphylococcus shinii TaxID=2912228 RepID=UPI00057C2165|nr:hypothetical protein [Staphylococcus shinii]